MFFDILAEDLARRDMDDAPIDESNYDELTSRIDAYIAEFEQHGTDNILVGSGYAVNSRKQTQNSRLRAAVFYISV